MTLNIPHASWVTEAAPLPVAFAQVREDPLLDAWVVNAIAPQSSIIMVASGGCTLAYLASLGRLGRIEVVDPNPAQIALAMLKLHLLQSCGKTERLRLLGHAPMPAGEREHGIRSAFRAISLQADAIGPPHIWAEAGPDHAGRYERVFAQLRKELEPHKGALEQLLSLRDLAEQARRVEPATPLGRALDEAFDSTMDLPNLVRLFGERATRNRVEPFARHFVRQTRHVLATLPAADNPYVWQVLVGRYPRSCESPWLGAPRPDRLPEITWSGIHMTEALDRSPGRFDFVHLSNILDWLDPDEARATLDSAYAALRPGGWTLIRQLNSTLDIAGLGEGFVWDVEEARSLHARDRSYFYRRLHLGRKQ